MQLEEKGKLIINETSGEITRVRRYMNGTKYSTEFDRSVVFRVERDDPELITDPLLKGQAQALKANFVQPVVEEEL